MNFTNSMIIRTLIKLIKNYIFIFKEIQKSSAILLVVLIFSTLVSGIFPIFTQYVLKTIISGLENNVNFNYCMILVGFYVLGLILKNIIIGAKDYASSIASFKVTHNIQAKLIEKIRNIDYKTFYSPDFQDFYTFILQNCQHEPGALLFTTMFIISLIVQLLSSFALIGTFNPTILVLLILFTIPSIVINLKIKRDQIKTLEERSLFYRKIDDSFKILTEKSFVKENRIFGTYNFFSLKRNFDFIEYLNIWKKFGKKEFLYKILSSAVPSVGIFLSVLLIILGTLKKECTIADFVFYSGIVLSIQNICEALIFNISQNYQSTLFIKKLFDFLEMKNEIESDNLTIDSKNSCVLEFKNVSFKYQNSSRYAVRNLNLKIKTGEQISLVGKNGCGKTTIINLILRIYDPTEGVILLNGIDIKSYNYGEYLKIFSAIFHDYQQYSINLCEYITIKHVKDPKDILKIKQATISATANGFIDKSPKGLTSNLTTKFDKYGLELSGGQWQKLAISRVFYSDANILIFDEPTSALDAISESEIYKNIHFLSKNKMLIFISHRMYASKLASRIIYMENGKIINDGTHLELIKTNTGYKKLFEEQANKYAT